MRALELHPNDIYKGNLILINRRYPIRMDEKEILSNLRPINEIYKNHLASFHVVETLKDIFDNLNCYDEIVPVSCFRSHQEQCELYNTSIIENGLNYTNKFVAVPDASELQSGLAVDLGKNVEDIDFICPELPYDGVYGDFRKEALLNGFIERYKKGKEGITGIANEPWHFRYVGVPHSIIIEENNLSLEEYHEFIKEFNGPEKSYTYKVQDYFAKIFYIKSSVEIQTIQIEDDIEYNVSGNNIDGFIITLYKSL